MELGLVFEVLEEGIDHKFLEETNIANALRRVRQRTKVIFPRKMLNDSERTLILHSMEQMVHFIWI